MAERLFVGVLGNRNSGKSSTWNSLFGRTVRRGQYSRHLELRPGEQVEVFLVSGSFEEREEYAGHILKNQDARIVLCSIQYIEEVSQTIQYITEEGFDILIQWLNPGHRDASEYYDRLGIEEQLLWRRATLSIRDGRVPLEPRVREIREFIYGWAAYRDLIEPVPA
jgi:hypothetical protein